VRSFALRTQRRIEGAGSGAIRRFGNGNYA
jgi:hypothetical protein